MRFNQDIIIIGILSALCLSACNLFQREQKAGAVVELDNHYLYASDLLAVTQYATTPEDSMRLADEYIRRWATDILQYQEGKHHSTPQLEAMIEAYRRSLYVSQYEQHIVERRMSRHVSKAEADTFYNHHPERFILQENILRGALLLVPKDAPQQDELLRRMQDLTIEDNLEYLEKYAYRYATGYELFTDQWRTANEVLLRMPTNNWQRHLASGRQFVEQDSVTNYILQVSDCRLIGQAMPTEYARPEIDKIILAERRISFLQQQRQELYDDAVRFGKIKFLK